MPLILDESQFNEFFDYELSVDNLAREQQVSLLFYQVSKRVNSTKKNEKSLINENSVKIQL